ncbi:Transcription termination/antitermination protein NusG [subsurface metagenome]
MAKGWYVVHTYSGYENKVQKHITRHIKDGDLSENVFTVKIPSEDVVEIRDGKRRITSKKFLPGYILLEMDLPETNWKQICARIRQIPGVTGFVGSHRNQKPKTISPEEAREVLQRSGEIKSEKVLKPKQSYSVGEMVRITEGPFDSFTGNIDEVNPEKGKLRVMVGIFGRSTPVEVDFLQVEKV